MEFLTLPSSFLSKTPHFSTPFTSSLTSLTKKTPFKFHKTLIKSFPNSPFSTNLPLQNTQKFHISARFGGPTKRRNSLRKKKLKGGDENDSKVSQNPHKSNDPFHDFVDDQIIDSNLDKFSFEKGVEKAESSQIDLESSNLENLREFGDSDLRDKLESWVEQYKKEIEFWGIGSNPIFTVFHDINGKVERVLFDEDEILKRNGVEPLYFKKEIELDTFDEVKSKIAHAKFLAKELEGGKNVISKDSSVAKFVVSGESSGLVSRIRSIVVPQKSLAKVSRVGIAVVCGFVVVSVIKMLFGMGGKEAEMTSFEKEMLRRKKKSRLSKEKLQKGSVEVMEKPLEPPIVITERPPLDKGELLDSIREAKGLSNSVVVLDVGGAQGAAENTVIDSKIWEIQMMARQARMIESGEGSPSERSETDGQTSDRMKETVAGPEDSILVDKLEKQVSDILPLLGEEAEEQEHAGNDTNLVNNLSTDNFSKAKILNGIPREETLDLETERDDATITNEKDSERNEVLETHRFSSGKIVGDQKSDDISDSLNLTDRIQSNLDTSQLNIPKKTPGRRKLKIIRSVKEAREYLMQKHDKKAEVGGTPGAAGVKSEGNGYHNQRRKEDDRALDSFDANKLVDSAPASKVSGDYTGKNECLASDTNGLKKETESDLSQDRPFGSPIVDNLGFDAALNMDKTINEMVKASDSRERLDLIPGEKNFCDTSEEAYYAHLTEQCLEKVDKSDDIPRPFDLSETSDLNSGRDSSHLAVNLTEESGVPHNIAHYDASLQKKVSLSDDNGSVKPSAVGRDLNGAGSDKNGLFPSEVKDEDTYKKNLLESELQSADTYQGSGSGVDDKEGLVVADKEKWLEKNFHEVEPILKKIGSGFRNSYNVAREKTRQGDNTGSDLMNLRSIKDATELEWMQDDKLREIVFKVRDNELAGRDPFHSMDPEDKIAFFKGLEIKVEEENQKLSTLHEWLHSNIENIDYGADGISIYDPPEKVMPRWKGPPLDSIPEFLNNSREQQQEASSLQKVNDSTKHDNVEASAKTSTPKSTPTKKVAKSSKTVIEASDGSIKPGKKSGKEFWQHTKKWTRGFLESYNAETDPDVKATMKDIGKDLDRWTTEKDIQDAADLMDNIPQKGKEFIEKKINKLKREMELFGPQAVVSKYREYAEEKEVDYLWWLDLPHVLCIELYTYEGEDQRVGFYSLEMATDLEIEPKPHHVIAFENPGDCKNFCYIIQAHLEMLGKGKAFIVPQPPKDVYQQAKANGFGVTVIRKGEVKLNVDQHLEEVEELITEIGSKIYHDKIMQERNVDISALMKGVFGVSPPSKRKRKKRARKRPSKS